MLVTYGSKFLFKASNAATPSTNPGTSIIPGISPTPGAWTQVMAGASLTQDIYCVTLWVHSGATTATSKCHTLDIGVDPAGGTAYVARVSNILCGLSSTGITGGRWYYLPIRIKAGSSVAVRIMGNAATAGTVMVMARFNGQPTQPEMVWASNYSETLGYVSGALGTGLTPGNSGVDGTWVSLGTVTRAMSFFQLGVQCNNATITALTYYFDLAYGNGTSKHIIQENVPVLIQGTAETLASPMWPFAYCEVPSGATIYVRGSCSGTTVTGWNATAVCFG